MFRILITIFIFSISLYLYKDYTEVMQLKKTYKTWAEIIKVEEKEIRIPKVGGIYLNWVATVSLKNTRRVNVYISNSPIPKIGDCLPITVGVYATGGMIAILNVEQWRYAASKNAPCI